LLRGRRALVALSGGVMLGIATLVRPILSFGILPAVLVLGALLLRGGAGFRKALGLALTCAIGALAVLGPWKIRNWRLTGDGSVSQIKNVSLYFFDAAAVAASLEHGSVRAVEERFGLHEFALRFGFVETEAEALGAGPSVESFP